MNGNTAFTILAGLLLVCLAITALAAPSTAQERAEVIYGDAIYRPAAWGGQ